ncbi:MAG: M23 family metallopeptidase [Patescibacteria group bacterium]|nr:M23 family metallopeptidase [Patescibacteria group bacterium]
MSQNIISFLSWTARKRRKQYQTNPEEIEEAGKQFNQKLDKTLSQVQVDPTINKVHLSGSLAKKAERSFIFFKNHIKRSSLQKAPRNFLPFAPSYVVHLTVILIALLVVWNNIEGRKDQNQGEERQGTSILFSGILKSEEERLVESRNDPEALPRGIGGFTSEVSATVLAAADNSEERGGSASDPAALPTVQGNALIPLPLLEQEVKAGPVEEARTEVVQHIVTPGESVSSIALQYGLSVATILSANNLSETSYIRPGDILKIPPVSGVLYTVKSGDTLGEISKTYQGDLQKIVEYNNLGSEANIQIGQSLMIPGGKIPPPPQYAPSEESSRALVYEPQNEEKESPSIPAKSKGGWIWPTTSHRINQYYSYRHHGVDIDGDIGSPIYAAASGSITFSGWRGGYGKNIIISHPNGTETLYAHLSSYKRTVGNVKAGELIGYMGSTGWSTGPHLHLEIRTSQGAVNPLNVMR